MRPTYRRPLSLPVLASGAAALLLAGALLPRIAPAQYQGTGDLKIDKPEDKQDDSEDDHVTSPVVLADPRLPPRAAGTPVAVISYPHG